MKPRGTAAAEREEELGRKSPHVAKLLLEFLVCHHQLERGVIRWKSPTLVMSLAINWFYIEVFSGIHKPGVSQIYKKVPVILLYGCILR